MVERNLWPKNKELPENNRALELGFRHSPEAVRQLAWNISRRDKITAEDLGLEPHPSRIVRNDFSAQRDFAIGSYLYFSKIGNLRESRKMSGYDDQDDPHTVKPTWNVTDLFIKPETNHVATIAHSIKIRNIVRPNIGKVVDDVNFIRSKKDVAIVFNHGKWNGFPHTGYMYMYVEAMEALANMEIDEKKVVFIIGGDTNHDIKLFGHKPFLNTTWRLSINSYLPYDILFSAENFNSTNSPDDYWSEVYKALMPDFVLIEENDPLAEIKTERLAKISKKILPIVRSRWGKNESGRNISQTNIRNLRAEIFFAPEQFDAMRNLEDVCFNRKANWKEFLQENGRL